MKRIRMVPILVVLSLMVVMPGCTPAAEPLPPTATVTLWTPDGAATSAPVQVTASASATADLAPVPTSTVMATSQVDWAEALNRVADQRGGEWHYLIRVVGGKTLAARGQDAVLHPASVIKVAIAALFFAALEQENPPEDLAVYLREHGTDGRSYEQLLRAMLVKSEEPAADTLQGWVEERLRPEDVLKSWGLEHTRLTPRRSTLSDLDLLFEGLWTGKWISASAREIIFALMADYTPNDELRLGGLRGCQVEGEGLHNKRGTLTDDLLIVGDAALVEHSGEWFFVGVLAYQAPEGQPQATYEEIEAGMSEFAATICSLWGAGN